MCRLCVPYGSGQFILSQFRGAAMNKQSSYPVAYLRFQRGGGDVP